jgi:hypothetical protein
MDAIPHSYAPHERAWLWAVALVCAAGLNGIFLYGSFARPDWVSSALANPVALAFIIEALLLTGLLAWLLEKWGVSGVAWYWFVVLALGGGLAFAVPVAILWNARRS